MGKRGDIGREMTGKGSDEAGRGVDKKTGKGR